MQKIGNITPTADANGEWTNGNVAAGTPPTIIDAAWLNTIQRELANVVTSSGLQLDPANDSQVLAAILSLTGRGRLLSVKSFTASGTWTKTSGAKNAIIKVWGGGGGGGNTTTSSSGGGAGGGGGYSEGMFDISAMNSTLVTIGAGGISVAANTSGAGGNGGNSSVGTLISASGGAGGTSTTGSPGGISTGGGTILSFAGQSGQGPLSSIGGTGGASYSTFGGLPHNSSAGDSGGFPGGGGAGGTKVSTTQFFASGPGGNGCAIIMEYT